MTGAWTNDAKVVPTVRGPRAADQIGVTLMHEHVFVVDPEVIANYGASWWDADERVADAAAKLEVARERGIDTVVDLTVLGIGRDIELIRQVAARTDMNIVVSTGLYTFAQLPRLFRNEGPGLAVDAVDPMTEAFLADIEVGIGHSGVRAGMLKAVWDTPRLATDAERVQFAVAQAQRESGTPITVHTSAERQTGIDALAFYRKCGVEPARLVIGHAGDSADVGYLRGLMDTGATVGFDRFGLDTYATTAQRVRTASHLCRLGYADRIILSQDSAAFTESWARAAAQSAQQRLLPNWHYTYIVDDVLDLLRHAGVTDGQIDIMMRENPRRLLSGQ